MTGPSRFDIDRLERKIQDLERKHAAPLFGGGGDPFIGCIVMASLWLAFVYIISKPVDAGIYWLEVSLIPHWAELLSKTGDVTLRHYPYLHAVVIGVGIIHFVLSALIWFGPIVVLTIGLRKRNR